MKTLKISVGIFFIALVTTAAADLTPWEDYETSEYVWQVTTVRVHANMDDAYLEGLRDTWVAGNKVSKKLGQIEDWKIMRSDMPQSGEFNLLLMVKFANTEMLAPSRERYNAFMKEWGEERNQQTTEFAQKNYPGMRDLTGTYLMRDITLK